VQQTQTQPVTRIELVDHIESAFAAGPASRSDLLAAAAASHARPEVIEVLQRLPDTQFRTVRDLWKELSDVPVGA
jgi:hypothetical protein